MCFTIPLEILDVHSNRATVEGGNIIMLDTDIRAKKGQYLQVQGNIAVGVLSRREGKKIQNLILSLATYE